MGLTTERKVFIGLAAIAVSALVIDQGLLAPKQASAVPEAFEEVAVTEQLVVPNHTPQAQRASAVKVLMERLKNNKSVSSEASLGSVFSLTKLVEPTPPGITQEAPVANLPADGNPDQGAFPVIEHRAEDLPVLSSAMPSRKGGAAVLGGKLLRVGQVGPNGYRLVSVRERTVIVEKESVLFTVEIPVNAE